MRRAWPMPGCGMSPSPAISFDVSTMTTRLRSSLSMRAHSRSIVVFPTPGRPSKQIDFPLRTTLRMISIVPKTARPTRAVKPDDLTRTIANRRDAMQRLLDARAIVGTERRQARDDLLQILLGHEVIRQEDEVVDVARFRRPPEIEHDLDDVGEIREANECLSDREGEDVEEPVQLPVRGNRLSVDGQHSPSSYFLASPSARALAAT